jgi:hypothetical protein
MAAQPGDPEAMHLYQLIGAPLLAVVQAEAQAAQTSADFIKRVGFESATPPGTPEKMLQDGGDIGDLRMATFKVDRPGPNGTIQPHAISIPVLSLLPIPLLQVKDAEFSFSIRVLTRVPLQSSEDDKQPGMPPSKDYLAPDRVEMKGLLAPHRSMGDQSSEMNINVKVRMEQADLPSGILKLLSAMDHATTQHVLEPEK